MTSFRGVVELGGRTATGIEVPEAVIVALSDSRLPAVVVTVGGHTYRTTAARMGGRYLVPLSAENRTAAGVAAGDEVDVGITLDTAPRDVEVPADLAAAMDAGARAFFDGLSTSQRKEWARWVEDAKRPATRTGRIEATVAALQAGRKTR